jgi:hypothetical protein
MNRIVSYHVFNGKEWLAKDKCTWIRYFDLSARFTDLKPAWEFIEQRSDGYPSAFVMARLSWK